MVIESFEPITWQKTLDETVGPLNGRDWRARWRARLKKVFEAQVVLVGEEQGQLAAMSTASLDRETALGYIDILAVARPFQRRGVGREMLQGMIAHLKSQEMRYVQLECLTGNAVGNALYASEGFQEIARHIRWFREI